MKKYLLKTISERHSCRIFKTKPITETDIRKILTAANQAPSAHNQQSWRFILLRDSKKGKLADLVVKKATCFPKPSSTLLRMAARSIHSAPVVIAVANTGELIEGGSRLYKVGQDQVRDFFRTMEIQSSAAAVENMLLAATCLGIGSVWLGILYLIKKEVLEFLQEPVGEFMAVVPIGYPNQRNPGPKKKSLKKIVKYL